MVRHWWLRAGGAFVTRGKDEGVTKPWREPVPLQGAAALTGHDMPTPATQRGGRGWGPGPGVPASWRGSFAKRVSSIQSTQGHLPRLKQVPGRPPHERLGPSAHRPQRFIGSSATPRAWPWLPHRNNQPQISSSDEQTVGTKMSRSTGSAHCHCSLRGH